MGKRKNYLYIIFLCILIVIVLLLFLFKKRIETFKNDDEKEVQMKLLFEENYGILNEIEVAKKMTEKYDLPVLYHCYWEGYLNEKNIVSIKSCYYFNVKNNTKNKIILWVKEINDKDELMKEAKKYVNEVRVFEFEKEIKDTPIEGYNFTNISRSPSFFSDTIRYTLLYNYGGCWFDLDIFFLRSLDPLYANYGNEVLVYQWQQEKHPNGAIFISLTPKSEKLKRNIEYICKCHRGWGFEEGKLTFDTNMDFLVLPCSWFDPYWRYDNPYGTIDFDDFFKNTNERVNFDNFCKGAFTFHWHNRWKRPVDPDSPFQQLSEIIDYKIDL